VAKDGGIGQHQFPVLSSQFPVLSLAQFLRTENWEPRTLAEVLFFQNFPMMQFMSGDEVGQRSHGYFVV